MLIYNFVCDVSKGFGCSHLVLFLGWLSSQTINSTRFSSSSSYIFFEFSMCSRGSENWFLSSTFVTVCSMMLTAKQSSVVFGHFMALKILNTVYLSFTLKISSPVTTLIRVLPIVRNSHPMMSEKFLSSPMPIMTMLDGQMNLSTFTKILSTSPFGKIYDLSANCNFTVMDFTSPNPNFS